MFSVWESTFQFRAIRLDPWSGNWDPTCLQFSQKKKKKEPDSASRTLIYAGHVCSDAVKMNTKDPRWYSSFTMTQTQHNYTWQEWLICWFICLFIPVWLCCVSVCVRPFLGNLFCLFASDVDIICASLVLLPREQSPSDLIQLFT